MDTEEISDRIYRIDRIASSKPILYILLIPSKTLLLCALCVSVVNCLGIWSEPFCTQSQMSLLFCRRL